jgi:hypothetical protein
MVSCRCGVSVPKATYYICTHIVNSLCVQKNNCIMSSSTVLYLFVTTHVDMIYPPCPWPLIIMQCAGQELIHDDAWYFSTI